MRSCRFSIPLICIIIVYCGCQKSGTSGNQAIVPQSSKQSSYIVYSPESVVTKVVFSDSPITSLESLQALLQAPPSRTESATTVTGSPGPLGALYEGYTKTLNCTTNIWTYVFSWRLTYAVGQSPSGTGQLTIGSYTTSAAFQVTSSASGSGLGDGEEFWIQYTLTVPNDANYCSASTMTEMVSWTWSIPGLVRHTGSAAATNSENTAPTAYVTYPDVVGNTTSNGNGTYEVYVVPGVLTCQTDCHPGTLGFPPTVYFYYQLQGSSTWSMASQAGNDLSGFDVQVNQAGTYNYYTQEDVTTGVLSGEIAPSTFVVAP